MTVDQVNRAVERERSHSLLRATMAMATLQCDNPLVAAAFAEMSQKRKARTDEAARKLALLRAESERNRVAHREGFNGLMATFRKMKQEPGRFAAHSKAQKKAMTKMGTWTEDEVAALVREVQSQLQHGGTKLNYVRVAAKVSEVTRRESDGKHRTNSQCQSAWRQTLDPNIATGAWTPEEQAACRGAVLQQRNKQRAAAAPAATSAAAAVASPAALKQPVDWAVVAVEVSKVTQNNKRRTNLQCQQAWTQTLDSNVAKGAWTPEETKACRGAVLQQRNKQRAAAAPAATSAAAAVASPAALKQPVDWADVAVEVSKVTQNNKRRTSKQCRDAWTRTLDPNIATGAWTAAEKTAFMLALEVQEGRRRTSWVEIATKVSAVLPGNERRTNNQCRKWFNDNVRTRPIKRARVVTKHGGGGPNTKKAKSSSGRGRVKSDSKAKGRASRPTKRGRGDAKGRAPKRSRAQQQAIKGTRSSFRLY